MMIIVAGGTGFVGAPLCAYLNEQGHEVLVLSRNVERANATLGGTAQAVAWDGHTAGAWAEALTGAAAVINLCGEGIDDKRWSAARKRQLIDSRVQSTQAIVEAIAQAEVPPKVLINASAIGWYGPRGDQPLTESASAGAGFLAELCADWEAAAQPAEAHCRVVCLRVGIVLGPGGGALAKMLPPFKMFVGGPLGNGKQQFSWIHRDDLIGLIAHALAHESVRGPLNATGPEPLPLKEFCAALGRALGRPSWAPVPAPILRIALGEISDVLLTGQRVIPQVAADTGYTFQYPTAEAALRDVFAT